MHSDGSSSESDVSVASVTSTESYSSVPRRQNCRRGSIASVCTSPTDDAYVMVLQNRQGLYNDLKSVFSLKDMCDVIFLVGKEMKPVYGIRAIIATRSRLFYQLILSHEHNRRQMREAKKSKLRKTLSKITLSCVGPRDGLQAKRFRCHAHKLVIPMATFDPETFQRFMNYIHCGSLTIDSNTVIGLMNAAYMFGFPEVKQACWDFAIGCDAREDNLSDLLDAARLYSDHKMTKELMQLVSRRMQARKRMEASASNYPDLLANHRWISELEEEAEDSLVT